MRLPLAAAVLLAASAAGAEPRVRVTFTITEPEFVGNLKDKRVPLERALAEDAALLAAESFGFVNWSAADDPAGPAPDAELRLIAAVRWSIGENGSEPSSRQVDELLDERLARPATSSLRGGPTAV